MSCFYKLLLLTGSVLLIFNVIGFFYCKTIETNHPGLLEDSSQHISEKEFWKNAVRKRQETDLEYANRLAGIVSQRMLLINPVYAKPTIFENWIIWILSNTYWDGYEWTNTRKAVRLGGGFCSQHAIVFNNILEQRGIKSRILGLGGHVVNEAFIDGKWRVYDPDYNVVFDKSLKELQDDPGTVYQAYRAVGRPEDEALRWQEVFASRHDNSHFNSSRDYSTKRYFLETASFFLIWIIPFGMIFWGWALSRNEKRRLANKSTTRPFAVL